MIGQKALSLALLATPALATDGQMSGTVASGIIVGGCLIGFAYALKLYQDTMEIKVSLTGSGLIQDSVSKGLLNAEKSSSDDHEHKQLTPKEIEGKLHTISAAIAEGAEGFLHAEYQYVAVFMAMMGTLLLVFLGSRSGVTDSWTNAIFSTVAFFVGGITSLSCGYAGMAIAVKANVRTATIAYNNPGQYGPPFATAFKAGGVMGYFLCSLSCIVLFILIELYKIRFGPFDTDADIDASKTMYECIAGYGLGGSSVALFSRVGGGIYTKAADVGADIFKLDGLKEDDPRNPAVIADNVGDNVGDIAGMGADLFGSFAESSCAAMVISSASGDLLNNPAAMAFPMLVAAVGLVCSLITSLFAVSCCLVTDHAGIEKSLKNQLFISTLLMTPALFILCYLAFPTKFAVSTVTDCTNVKIFWCVAMGLWSGLIIGLVTEYYTSNAQPPTIELALKSKNIGGAPVNIIYGLALGYKSVVIPVFCLAATVYVTYTLAAMYGVACGAIGILSTLACGLTIDGYGPITDNAGGICEMSEMPENVREVTDALDAAGNTTAAIGKGFAIGSAAMVGLALFGAFVSLFTTGDAPPPVNVLDAWVFAGILIGAMLPYWFSAMTMKSVGEAAAEMALEVGRQFRELKLLEDPNAKPQYKACVEISTKASLKEMIAPGALVLLSPLLCGYLLGVKCLAGLMVGVMTSGVQMAISASNSGGAWDNAKKYVSGNKDTDGQTFKKKFPEWHKNTVVGDTVGDPMKDTSGPSLNILIKLTAITSLVFGPSMAKTFDDAGILEKIFS